VYLEENWGQWHVCHWPFLFQLKYPQKIAQLLLDEWRFGKWPTTLKCPTRQDSIALPDIFNLTKHHHEHCDL
jgi:hypothetical protein